MDANYFSSEPYAENPIEVVAPTDTSGSSAYAYHYTLDGSTPDESDPLFTSNITLNYGDTLKVRRYGVGTSNSSYYPSPTLAVPNYNPEIILEECCNLYDQLVWEGNTDKINTFWNNKPLFIEYKIKKIHDTYFMFLTSDHHNYYYDNTDSSSSQFLSLDEFYCKAIIFYSKDLKNWEPLPGFENDFSSPVNLRGKISSKYPLDIFYQGNKFHIIYLTINPDKIESYIAAEVPKNSYSDITTYKKYPKKLQLMDVSSIEIDIIGGWNSDEAVNLYEFITTSIGEEGTTNSIYENIQNAPELKETNSSENATFNLDSRFVHNISKSWHLTTENRLLLSLSWVSFYKFGENVPNFCKTSNTILLEKRNGENSFLIKDTFSKCNNSVGYSNGAGYYTPVFGSIDNLYIPAGLFNQYYKIPFVNSINGSSWPGSTFYTRNFDRDNISYNESYGAGNDVFLSGVNPINYDSSTNLFYYNDSKDNSSSYLVRFGNYSSYMDSSSQIINIPGGTSLYNFKGSFYIDNLGFYVYLYKDYYKQFEPSENDKIVCVCTGLVSSEGCSYINIPKNYKIFIHDENATINAANLNYSTLSYIPEDNIGYVNLFNEDNEPILFKIHLENPTKQTEESQISTMSLDDKKIYRLQTRRINIEENKESTTNETQSLTTDNGR